MLKTLIVDDERLIRVMLRGLLPWEEHGITLVGEACNGTQALAFLAQHPVDLLLSDLTMPGLCGFPFIQRVRELFPQVRIVVLTMHNDFGFLQEAMRLGVTDYIAKNQLKDKSLPHIIDSIVQRIHTTPTQGQQFLHGTATILYNPAQERLKEAAGFSALAKDLCILPHVPDDLPPHCLLLSITHIPQQAPDTLALSLRAYIQSVLFYRYSAEERYGVLDFQDICPIQSAPQGQTTALLNTLVDLAWVQEDAVYVSMLDRIAALHLGQEEVSVFFYQLYLLCNQHVPLDLSSYFTDTSGFYWWWQWTAWLGDLRAMLYPFIVPSGSAKFIMEGVVNFLTQQYHTPITLDAMLRKTAMSRSGFSHEFKEHTGKTFSEYLQDVRIQNALFLLENTHQSVAEIAERVGYNNDRNFRRAFANKMGRTPNAYRKNPK